MNEQEIIILSELTHTQKDKCHMFSSHLQMLPSDINLSFRIYIEVRKLLTNDPVGSGAQWR